MAKAIKSTPLLTALGQRLEKEEALREELIDDVKAVVVFNIDGEHFTLDLRKGKGNLSRGKPEGKPDLTLTVNDDNFVKLVNGKLGPQQAFLMRKLKIQGKMGLAMKMESILEAAAPKSKL